MGRKRKRRRAPDAGAYQAPAEPALAPARPIIFRFRRWMQFEPDPKYRQRDDPSPLAYVRTWINEDRIGGTTTCLEIMQSRRAILNAGGPKLYGMYRLLVEYSADLRFLRGYLADHMGQPAGPETIAGT
ncbi:MAG TPA: hypothetical protein VMW52_12695, partial [Phycisphaerae bacterium]|nr:hypothetical protein [Phycisphaerae bacterium]